MPYIPKFNRMRLDPYIDALVKEIALQQELSCSEVAFAGLLNYTCTTLSLRVIHRCFRLGGMRYWILAVVTGVFKNIADEFYRRVAAPYEDQQIAKNGDLEVFQKCNT